MCAWCAYACVYQWKWWWNTHSTELNHMLNYVLRYHVPNPLWRFYICLLCCSMQMSSAPVHCIKMCLMWGLFLFITMWQAFALARFSYQYVKSRFNKMYYVFCSVHISKRKHFIGLGRLSLFGHRNEMSDFLNLLFTVILNHQSIL